MIDILEAVLALDPNAWAGCSNNNINNIHWYDNNPNKITKEQILSKQKELQADYDSKQYQRDRAAAYPSWQTQMDLLYHGGVDALKAELKKTKDKFPKP
tara:strand:+ start:386 stop:682 length:297 start_codon:yes stop_codon:yes gene_type:complete